VFASVSIDKNTGKSKKCGIVQFETPSMAKVAIREMRNYPMNGATLYVREDVQESKQREAAFSSFGYMGSFFHGYDIVGSESGLWDGGYHSNEPYRSGYYSNAINHIRDIDTYYLRASDWLLQADRISTDSRSILFDIVILSNHPCGDYGRCCGIAGSNTAGFTSHQRHTRTNSGGTCGFRGIFGDEG
jgi:RNA recognition motif-containing protein